MKRLETKSAKPRRKRLRRVLWGLGAFMLLTLLLPFVFTGSLLRFYLAHSGWRELPLRFRTASLSLTGRLTLYDVELDDTAESAGRRLLFAEQASVTFNWLKVPSNRVQAVQLENLELALHPGNDTPATLLRLFGAAPVSAPTSASQPAAATPPPAGTPAAGSSFWCDDLIVTGHVRFAGYDPWMPLLQVRENDPIPLHLVIHFAGTPARPQRDVSLLLGDADLPARPVLSGVFKWTDTAHETLLNFDRLHIGNLSPAATASVLQAWPNLPPALRHPAEARFDRLILSGTLAIGRDVAINANAELRDFSGRTSLPAGTLTVEHLAAATHVEGRFTAAPLKDLKFSRTRCSWDTLQLADWKLQKGVADFQLDGPELSLTDLQADSSDVHVAGTAALDLSSGLLTRGRLWTGAASAQHLRERLPESAGRYIPEALEGAVAARVFLAESDREHITAYVELAGPDTLTFNVPGPATAPSTRPGTRGSGPDWPGAVLSNAMVSGTVSWALRLDTPPEISRGRLTADQLLLISPAAGGRAGGTALNRIKSDFNIAGNLFRLDDFYADLPGNGRLALEGNYALDDASFEEVVLSLNGVDLALANPWLPAGWSLAGQVEGEWHGGYSRRAASLDGSLGLGPQVVITAPGGKLALAGAPPILALRFATDRRTGLTQVQAAEISGVSGLQADAGFMKALRNAVSPLAESAAAALFDRVAGGGYASFDKIGLTGRLGPADAAGTISCGGLDLGTPADAGAAEKLPILLNLTARTDIAARLLPGFIPDPATIRLSSGQFLAEKLSLGQNVFTEISGNFSADREKVYLTHGALSVAEGTVEGDATLRFDGALDALHLGFTGLHQQALWRNFKPDVFTATGPISGKLTLLRNAEGKLTGAMEMAADGPGRLKISRQASQATFAEVAKAAMVSPDAVLPVDFEDIVLNQLADYPYLTGKASLVDDAGGLHLKLDYAREPLQEGDPGYGVPVTVAGQAVKANLVFQLQGGTVTLRRSVVELLEQFLGF